MNPGETHLEFHLQRDIDALRQRVLDLGRRAGQSVQRASQALLQSQPTEDEALARSSIPIEAAADQLRDQIREHLLQRQARNELSGSALNLLLTVARRLERVTDQARGVCEEILFVCTGQPAREIHEGPVRVLFVDDTHACLGHLAEALGRHLASQGFQFTSAGLHPVPPLPALRDFLQQRRIDTSCLVSRSLGQVPPPEEHDLVIALTPRAQQAFPMSARSLCLFWPLEDPAAFPQPGPTLELAWQSLEHRLRPLLDAVLRD